MVKAKLLVIGDEPLAIGFRLAGVENVIQASKDDFQRKLEAALENKEFGVIVVNELMFNTIDWKLRKRIETNPYPIIIKIPDISGSSEEGESIRELVKRALGIDITTK
jgi:V/A-type H+-transporting ATPase subunit F